MTVWQLSWELACGPTTTAWLAVINDAWSGPGSVYLTTHSVLVTWIGAVIAVILGGLALLVRWPAVWPDAKILTRMPHAPAICRT